ncbi:Rrf2 family transcriptional regulator [Candidatus Aerophobetes bacterium]|uniref:Rrf2 family transcriptional regulator n=1 Tax=Aerophobetes bacterium TaxID=2030807 RepID=A0A523RPW1_UNCAE|nr:MAG: Rrf2 family transcriptional regulator [Candidatus Aerophobetes bacterium]
MMRISTKGRYGARLMLELALYYGKGPVSLKDIAKREEISEGYLEHLLPSLKAAGLVNSSRGAHGGYTLAKTPSKITLREVVQALEGPLSPAECVHTPNVCQRVRFCVTRDIWKKLGEKISQTLESVTLKDMVEMQKNKGETSLIYNI